MNGSHYPKDEIIKYLTRYTNGDNNDFEAISAQILDVSSTPGQAGAYIILRRGKSGSTAYESFSVDNSNELLIYKLRQLHGLD